MKFKLTISEFRSLFLRKVIGFKKYWLMPYSDNYSNVTRDQDAEYMREYRIRKKNNARFTL